MKIKKGLKIYILAACILCTLLLFPTYIYAQLRSDSNPVTTRVGNPAGEAPGDRSEAPDCPNGNCRQAVLDKFNVSISSALPDSYALFAWEKLWDTEHTNFDELVSGVHVEISAGGSYRNGNTIYLKATYQREFFYVIFVHEMGHVINDLDDPISKRTLHRDLWYVEGGLTGYGQTACLYDSPSDGDKIEEDYADMLTYYLNPGVPDQTTNVCDLGIAPYANGNNQEYFNLARSILDIY